VVKHTKKKSLFSEAISLGLCIIIILAVKSSIICNYTVPTGSMVPTILPGDKLIVNKMAYNLRIPFTEVTLWEFSNPERGEIFIFDSPEDSSMTMIKRIIGLPGDELEVVDGIITVNKEPLTISVSNPNELFDILTEGGTYEETIGKVKHKVQRLPHYPREDSKRWTIPTDHYFAMGDNRDNSSDSRFWGVVHKSKVWGKANFLYFSIDWPTYSQWPKVRWNRIGKELI